MTARRIVIAEVLADWDSYDDETRRVAGPLPDLIDDALTLNGYDLPLLNGHVFLNDGTLDFGFMRSSIGWPALRYVLIRPWRWHTIPRVVRMWRSQ